LADQEDPTTGELKLEQLKRELAARDAAEKSKDPTETGTWTRRADKTSYLRQKLEQREEAERKAAAEDE
jgi:hypothetical protein